MALRRRTQNSSPRDAVVLGPFGGSGTTLIACQETGRRARLLELDPRYVDVIVRRWEEFTGLQAVLDAGGMSLADLRKLRDAGGS